MESIVTLIVKMLQNTVTQMHAKEVKQTMK